MFPRRTDKETFSVYVPGRGRDVRCCCATLPFWPGYAKPTDVSSMLMNRGVFPDGTFRIIQLTQRKKMPACAETNSFLRRAQNTFGRFSGADLWFPNSAAISGKTKELRLCGPVFCPNLVWILGSDLVSNLSQQLDKKLAWFCLFFPWFCFAAGY